MWAQQISQLQTCYLRGLPFSPVWAKLMGLSVSFIPLISCLCQSRGCVQSFSRFVIVTITLSPPPNKCILLSLSFWAAECAQIPDLLDSSALPTVVLFSVRSFLTFIMSLGSPIRVSTQGISKPSWGKSAEKCLVSITWHWMVPPVRRNSEHTADIFRGTWPMVVVSVSHTTDTAHKSLWSPVSLLRINSSAIAAFHTSLYIR